MCKTDVSYDHEVVIDTGSEQYILAPTGLNDQDFLYRNSQGAVTTLTLEPDTAINLPGNVEAYLARRPSRFALHTAIVLSAPKSVTFTKRPTQEQ